MTYKFFCRRDRNHPDELTQTLLVNGYIWTDQPEKADFLFVYDDAPNNITTLRSKPMFIAPHTPYSFFVWDIGDPHTPNVLCNFVVSDAAVESMRLYGYPHRFEKVGFFGGPIKPFQPTTGTKLIFAPQHAVHDKRLPTPDHLTWAREASHWILKNRPYFESVTVRYTNTLEICGLEEFRGKPVIFEHVDPYAMPYTIKQHALAAINKSDFVISLGTFGYLAIATGKPTVLYGHRDAVACNREGKAQHYELYRHLMHFPIVFEDMSALDVLELRCKPNEQIEEWKRLNIGDPFNPEKFISVIREYY